MRKNIASGRWSPPQISPNLHTQSLLNRLIATPNSYQRTCSAGSTLTSTIDINSLRSSVKYTGIGRDWPGNKYCQNQTRFLDLDFNLISKFVISTWCSFVLRPPTCDSFQNITLTGSTNKMTKASVQIGSIDMCTHNLRNNIQNQPTIYIWKGIKLTVNLGPGGKSESFLPIEIRSFKVSRGSPASLAVHWRIAVKKAPGWKSPPSQTWMSGKPWRHSEYSRSSFSRYSTRRLRSMNQDPTCTDIKSLLDVCSIQIHTVICIFLVWKTIKRWGHPYLDVAWNSMMRQPEYRNFSLSETPD